VFKSILFGCVALLAISAARADQAAPSPSPAAAPAAAGAAGGVTTAQLVSTTPKGQLKNPYKDDDAAAVEDGRKAYFRAGCNGCHGGNGGGGMCPPLTNDTWVYGGDDDTLFRLVTLGSDDLQTKGYTRTGHENVVGPMPPMGAIVASADTLWHILAFVRSNYHGAPECKFGCPAQTNP
jgi:mono/diheme cytochrome c family protein